MHTLLGKFLYLASQGDGEWSLGRAFGRRTSTMGS